MSTIDSGHYGDGVARRTKRLWTDEEKRSICFSDGGTGCFDGSGGASLYREGKRIASTAAEASVNNLVARRMVKKQQMRWSERRANLLLQVRVAIANGDLADRLAYQPPIQSGQALISPFVPDPRFQHAA